MFRVTLRHLYSTINQKKNGFKFRVKIFSSITKGDVYQWCYDGIIVRVYGTRTASAGDAYPGPRLWRTDPEFIGPASPASTWAKK